MYDLELTPMDDLVVELMKRAPHGIFILGKLSPEGELTYKIRRWGSAFVQLGCLKLADIHMLESTGQEETIDPEDF